MAHSVQAYRPFQGEILAGKLCFRLGMRMLRSRLTFYALRGEGKDSPVLMELVVQHHSFHGRTTLPQP